MFTDLSQEGRKAIAVVPELPNRDKVPMGLRPMKVALLRFIDSKRVTCDFRRSVTRPSRRV